MNPAITVSSAGTWEVIKRSHLMAVAAGAVTGLALATVLAGSVMMVTTTGGQDAQAPDLPSNQTTWDTGLASPAMTYYLVDSEEQRDSVLEQAALRDGDHPNRNRTTNVLVAGTAEEEARMFATLHEVKGHWAAAGITGLEIVDLRETGLPGGGALPASPVIVYLVETQAIANNVLAAVRNDRTDTSGAAYFAFKASTAEEEAGVNAIIATWMGDYGDATATWWPSDVRIIDLRLTQIE